MSWLFRTQRGCPLPGLIKSQPLNVQHSFGTKKNPKNKTTQQQNDNKETLESTTIKSL